MRDVAEWSYKYLKQMWTLKDFDRFIKVRKEPILLMFTASTVFLNFKTCLENSG